MTVLVIVGSLLAAAALGAALAWFLRGQAANRELLAEQNITDAALCRLIDQEVAEVRAETGRSQALLRDAVGMLNTSFSDMVQQTRQQGDMIVGLVEPGTGSPGVRRFADTAGALVATLASILEQNGRDSVHVVQSMDGTVACLDQLFAGLAALPSAGGADVEGLRTMIRTSREALMRTREVVEERADQAMSIAIDGKLQADALVRDVHQINRALADGMQVVADCSEHIRESVSLLVRSLQFEDITTQSLGTANAHLERLQDLGREATRLLAQDAATPDARLAALREFGIYLRLMREGSVRPVRKPISQTGLDTGAVDLF